MKIRTRILAILVACTVVVGMIPIISFAGNGAKKGVSNSVSKVVATSVSSTEDSISLKWKKVSGAEGYQFAYKKSSSDKYSYLDISSDKTSFKKTELSSNTKYKVKVRAYKYNGLDRVYGEYSNIKTIVTKNINPKKVAFSKVKSGKAKATVSWKKVSGAKGYVIAYKKTSSKKWSTKTVSASKLSTTLTKLKRHKYYNIKVKAFNYEYKNGKKVKNYGAYSAVKKIKIK